MPFFLSSLNVGFQEREDHRKIEKSVMRLTIYRVVARGAAQPRIAVIIA